MSTKNAPRSPRACHDQAQQFFYQSTHMRRISDNAADNPVSSHQLNPVEAVRHQRFPLQVSPSLPLSLRLRNKPQNQRWFSIPLSPVQALLKRQTALPVG